VLTLDLGNKFSPNPSHYSIMHECCSNCLVPNLLNASVGYKKGLEKMSRIGRMIAIIELPKPTFTNGEQVYK
jgi:hypothetical protein